MCANPALPCRRSVRMRPATRTARLGGFQRGGIGRRILFDQAPRRVAGPFKFVRIGLMAASFDFGKLLLALEILVVRLKR